MKILIVSDTHGRNGGYLDLLEQSEKMDMVIHCGDVEGSEYLISESAGCRTVIVQGNNDCFSDLPREAVVQLGKYKALVTHGHPYYVNMGYDHLVREAKKRKMDMVIYGHTHRPVIAKENGIWVLNPGSLTYPRQEGRKYTYIIMEIDEDGEIECTLHHLEN